MRAWRRVRRVWVVAATAALAVFYVSDADWAVAARRVALAPQWSAAVAALAPAAKWAALAAAAWIALAFVLGRVFCSIGCPAGWAQELSHRLGKTLRTARTRFAKPSRGGVAAMALAAAAAFAGWMQALDAFDPLGLFGRMAEPLAVLWRRFVFDAGEFAPGWAMAGVGLIGLLLLVAVPLFKGRWFCDRLCPVGACLGLAAGTAPAAMRLDPDACRGCGRCERQCPTRCIDAKARALDPARCVLCLDCADACPHQALRYGKKPHGKKTRPDGEAMPGGAVPPETPSTARPSAPTAGAVQTGVAPPSASAGGSGGEGEGETVCGRRAFLGKAGAWTAAGAFVAARPLGPALWFDGEADSAASWPSGTTLGDRPMPPGAMDWRTYRARCVGCQACVRTCPAGIIRSSPDRLMPRLDYDRGYCQYECTRCMDACPSGALRRPGKPDGSDGIDKTHLRLATNEMVLPYCVVLTKGTSCGACAEVCPTHALTMVRQADPAKPTVPDNDAEHCVGCGACYHVCPAAPRAFVIRGLSRHERSKGVRDTGPAAIQLKPADESGLHEFPF